MIVSAGEFGRRSSRNRRLFERNKIAGQAAGKSDSSCPLRLSPLARSKYFVHGDGKGRLGFAQNASIIQKRHPTLHSDELLVSNTAIGQLHPSARRNSFGFEASQFSNGQRSPQIDRFRYCEQHSRRFY